MATQLNIDGTFVYDWRHYIDENEKVEIQAKSVELRNKVDKLKANKKVQVKIMQTEIDEVEGAEKNLREQLHDGFVDKSMRVKKEEDFQDGKIYYYSAETGELVHTEEMTSRERRGGSSMGAAN